MYKIRREKKRIGVPMLHLSTITGEHRVFNVVSTGNYAVYAELDKAKYGIGTSSDKRIARRLRRTGYTSNKKCWLMRAIRAMDLTISMNAVRLGY